jgi:hypothetical protein
MSDLEFFLPPANAQYRDIFVREGKRTGIPPQLLAATTAAEVGPADTPWNTGKRNGNALGLGQFMPDTWGDVAYTAGAALYDRANRDGLTDHSITDRTRRSDAKTWDQLQALRTDPALSIATIADNGVKTRHELRVELKKLGVNYDSLSPKEQDDAFYGAHHDGAYGYAQRFYGGKFDAITAKSLLLNQLGVKNPDPQKAQLAREQAQEWYRKANGDWGEAYRLFLKDFISRKFRPGDFLRPAPAPVATSSAPAAGGGAWFGPTTGPAGP